MKMLKRALILGMLISLAPSLSFAQPDPVRQRGEEACGGDARRFCRKVLDQGDGVVLNCLQTNQKKLSSACRKMLEDNGQL
jgi:Cysteine rich repeat